MPNIILTGLPRSGSTLTCSLLSQCNDTVGLHEPWPIGEMIENYSLPTFLKSIDCSFKTTRTELLETKTTTTKVIKGLGITPRDSMSVERNNDNLRYSIVEVGKLNIGDKPLSEDFTLAVKHISGFTPILNELTQLYPCFGIVRHPLAVLVSWSQVDIPMRQGALPMAEKIDDSLRASLNSIHDVVSRRAYLLHWLFSKITTYLQKDHIIYYEMMIATGGRALQVITPQAKDLKEDLSPRNMFAHVSSESLIEFADNILAIADSPIWSLYAKEPVQELVQRLKKGESITDVQTIDLFPNLDLSTKRESISA